MTTLLNRSRRARRRHAAAPCREASRSWSDRAAGGYRAVTLGDSKDDWVVLNERGDVVYRGYMIFAARVATRLNAG